MMLKMGFHVGWIDIIMDCSSTPSFSVLINREAKGHIRPQRGLRQGDTLSPYLFLICAEGLSTLTNHAHANGRFSGITISPTYLSISHLLFADDSLVFCKVKVGGRISAYTWQERDGSRHDTWLINRVEDCPSIATLAHPM